MPYVIKVCIDNEFVKPDYIGVRNQYQSKKLAIDIGEKLCALKGYRSFIVRKKLGDGTEKTEFIGS